MTRTHDSLGAVTISLHWLVGLTFIGLMALGIYMEETHAYEFYDLHKSIGALLLLLVVPRIVWRFMQGFPAADGDATPAAQKLAKAVQYLLLAGTLLMPVSGIMMSAFGGHGLAVFGMGIFPENPDPSNPGEVIPFNGALAQVGHVIHGLGGKLMILAILLHLAGALKHHFIDKDKTLVRMVKP